MSGHLQRGVAPLVSPLVSLWVAVLACVPIWAGAGPAQATDRASVDAFLKVTGFDVAIESIALSAENAPDMLGMDAGEFGVQWAEIAKRVFAPDIMVKRATDILAAALDDEMLAHATAFYGSDLGKRLVEAENATHFADDEMKRDTGADLVAEMVRTGSPRLDLFNRMNHAIDPNDIGPKAIQEIQVRFLLAASYAGVIKLRVDEDGLRAALARNDAAIRRDMAATALANSAYTYRAFTDEEVRTYTEALETPQMQMVYELMNAVHYEVMMNRFEVLATKLGKVAPGQEL